MRTQQEHGVPLCRQAKVLLLQPLTITGLGQHVFPRARGKSRLLSENGVSIMLRAMGDDNDTMIPHGFRATARTTLDGALKYRREWIEYQIACELEVPNEQAYKHTTQ